MPELPEFLRGRQLVVIDGAVLGSDDRGAELLAGLRALRPEMDTFARVPAKSLVRLHMDPEGDAPFASDTAMLGSLPDAAIDAFLDRGRAGRHDLAADGRAAPARRRAGPPARGRRGAEPPRRAVRVLRRRDRRHPGDGCAGRTPTRSGSPRRWRRTPTAGSTSTSPRTPSTPARRTPTDVWTQLKGIRCAVDPHGIFAANHPVPRLFENGATLPSAQSAGKGGGRGGGGRAKEADRGSAPGRPGADRRRPGDGARGRAV